METGHRFPYTEHSIHHCHSDLYFRLWGRRLCERGSHVLCSECLLHPDPSRLLSLSCHCTFTKNGRVCGDVSASLLSLSTTRSRRWDLYELLGHTARVCQDVPWQHLTHFPGPWNHPPSLKWIFNKKNCPLKEINYERQIDFYFEKIFSFNKTI